MKLKNLHINLQEWGVNAGRYTGTISFEGESGTIDLNLNPSVSEEILKVCAEELIVSSKSLSRMLTMNLLESTKRLIGVDLDATSD